MSTTNATQTLDGRLALVTGATSGIGQATALELARRGAEVIVHGRDAARGAETVAAITAAGGRARFAGADLTDPDAVRRLATEAGSVDILINNAGLAVFGPTAELDLEDYDRMFAANVRPAFLLVGALAPGMAGRGRGAIVSVSSMAARIGMAGGAAYGATKVALEAMTRAWAAEYSADGVRVNAIAPGPVYTPTPSGRDFITRLGQTTALRRASEPEEIALAIAFLASPDSGYVTGTTLAADGGRTAI